MPHPLALGETPDGFLTLFSLAALQIPGAGFLLTLSKFSGQGFNCLDHYSWSVSFFRLLLMVELAIYVFYVTGPQAFWPVLSVWVVFTPLCCTSGLGHLRPLSFFEGCVFMFFLLFYFLPFNLCIYHSF
jgi:hypothetical protein